jgi:hypothetical protein
MYIININISNMKTKIIPFDLEIAKKIQAGEIDGKIKTRESVEIHEFFFFSEVAVGAYPVYATIDGIVHSYCYDGYERNWDRSGYWKGDLVLEVPNTEPQFKPFDRVLMRNINTNWFPAIFSSKELTGFRGIGGELCAYCIPYEGNEYLVGTNDKPKGE